MKIEGTRYDDRGNQTYWETSNGWWCKMEYDDNNNYIYYEFSDGDWGRKENGKEIEYIDKKYYINDEEVTKKEVDKLLNNKEAKEE